MIARRVLLLLVSAVLLQSCASVSIDAPFAKNKLRSVSIQADANANNSSATAIDLVFIYDAEIAEQLAGISGQQWFESKSQFKMSYQQDIKVLSKEIAPFTQRTKIALPNKYKGAVSVRLFVNYVGNRTLQSAEIGNLKDPLTILRQNTFEIRTL